MKTITIKIIGAPGSGKTGCAYALQHLLLEKYGIYTNYTDPDGVELSFDDAMARVAESDSELGLQVTSKNYTDQETLIELLDLYAIDHVVCRTMSKQIGYEFAYVKMNKRKRNLLLEHLRRDDLLVKIKTVQTRRGAAIG